MARTQTSERHRDGQAALVAGIGVLIRHAWLTLLDPHDLKGSSPKLTAAVEAIVSQYGHGSSAAALNSYRLQRREAGVLGRPSLRMPPLPSHEDVTATVEHVLSPLYGPWSPDAESALSPAAPSSTPAVVVGPADVVAPTDKSTVDAVDAVAVQAAEQALESSVERLVLDQGRTAIIDAVQSDKAAKGWARVTEPGACYFCAMLASRGAVYKTRETADFRAHVKQPNSSGGTCRCHVEPVFNAYEPTAQARQWTADWDRLKDENGGSLSLIDWRRAFEGRDGSGRPPLG